MEYKRYDTLYWIIFLFINLITLMVAYFKHPNAPIEKYTSILIILFINISIIAYKTHKWLKEPD